MNCYQSYGDLHDPSAKLNGNLKLRLCTEPIQANMLRYTTALEYSQLKISDILFACIVLLRGVVTGPACVRESSYAMPVWLGATYKATQLKDRSSGYFSAVVWQMLHFEPTFVEGILSGIPP